MHCSNDEAQSPLFLGYFLASEILRRHVLKEFSQRHLRGISMMAFPACPHSDEFCKVGNAHLCVLRSVATLACPLDESVVDDFLLRR